MALTRPDATSTVTTPAQARARRNAWLRGALPAPRPERKRLDLPVGPGMEAYLSIVELRRATGLDTAIPDAA